MVGHLPTFHGIVRIAEHVVDVALKGHASQKRRGKLAVTREEPIVFAQGIRAAENAGFFAETTDVETDSSLALQENESFIEESGAEHRAVEENHFVDAQAGIVRGIERSIVSNDANDIGRAHIVGMACRSKSVCAHDRARTVIKGPTYCQGGCDLDGVLQHGASYRRGACA